MKKFILFLLVLFLFGNKTEGQNELDFEFDYARFNYDSTAVYLEFYYDLNPQKMKALVNGLYEAIVHIELKDLMADTFYLNKDWKIQGQLNPADSVIKTLTGVFGFAVPEGDYALTVKAYDAQNKALSKLINERIYIEAYKKEKYAVSDIQLATNIKREDADPNSLFYKNTLEVIPNPSMFYSNKAPIAFYYAELYNLTRQEGFTLQKLLYNSAGTSVFKQEKIIKQNSPSLVEIGLINLSKYPTDSYNLVFSLIDNETNQAFISSKRFYLYNPGVVDSAAVKKISSGVIGSEFAIYSKEECDLLFAQSKYIASQAEIEKYQVLDSLGAKREFLYYFWQSRDTNPSTPQNEFKEDYFKRVEYANSKFKYGNKEGFRTDRGRVYLIYGEPDQKDFFPSEPDLKPYEIWFYNGIEGGVTFIFGDVTGFGNYELLHSTKRGEVLDEGWMRRLGTK